MTRKGTLIFLVALLVVLLPALLQIAAPFITPFILAAVLAIMMHPAKERLQVRIRRPGLASMLTTLASVSLLVVIIAVAGFHLTRELTEAYQALSQRSLEEGGWPALAAHTTDRVVDAVADRLPVDKEAVRTELIDRMKTASAYLLRHLGVAVGGITNIIVTFFLVAIFLYFLLRYGSEWVARVTDMVPLDARTTRNILRTAHESVLANLNGMFAVVIGQGVLLSVGFWLVGVQSPLLWGAIGGLASIIPVVGALLIWAPVAVGYLVMQSYGKALFLALWGAVVVGSADNVLRPLVAGKRQNQHPMLIALSAIGGTYAFGALGIVLGPLLVSVAAALLTEIRGLTTINNKEQIT